MMWRMSYQDYRGWRQMDLKEPRPPVQFEDYPDKDAAVRAKERAIAEGFTACVAPTPDPKVIWGKRNHKLVDGQRFNASWRLKP